MLTYAGSINAKVVIYFLGLRSLSNLGCWPLSKSNLKKKILWVNWKTNIRMENMMHKLKLLWSSCMPCQDSYRTTVESDKKKSLYAYRSHHLLPLPLPLSSFSITTNLQKKRKPSCESTNGWTYGWNKTTTIQEDWMISLCKCYLAETKVKVTEIALPGMTSTNPASMLLVYANLNLVRQCRKQEKKVAGNRPPK